MNRITVRLSNVVVNAKAVVQAVDELEPLAALMPADVDDRHKYTTFLSNSALFVNS